MYAELLAIIARAIGKNHGFIFPDNLDILRHESARAYLYTSDAEIALEIINKFLEDNEIDFDALEVADGYIMPTVADPVVNSTLRKLDWVTLDQLVNEMYKIWGVKRADRSTLEQYEVDRLNAIDDHFTHAELIEIYQGLSTTAINPYYAPQTDKSKLGKAIFEMLNPYKGWLKVNLYFDADYKCIGGEACDRWATSYKTNGDKIHYERVIMLKAGYNPLNRVLLDILQQNTDDAFALDKTPEAAPETTPEADNGLVALGYKNTLQSELNPASAPAPELKQHGPRYKDAKPAPELPGDFFLFCTKAEKTLYQTSFVGLEKAFKEFLVVKQELAAIKITVGKMTASQTTIKSWNINGGEAGKGKTALFWDTQDGWTVGPRTESGTLPEGIEGWVLMEHLAENNARANNLHAAHWYDQTDEDAEAEAVALQQKESKTR